MTAEEKALYDATLADAKAAGPMAILNHAGLALRAVGESNPALSGLATFTAAVVAGAFPELLDRPSGEPTAPSPA